MPGGLHDMAQMSVSGTPGTGTITLNAAVAGYQTFAAAGVRNNEIITYSITDASNAWEVGRGVYTTSGTTLTRSTILYSSNSNTAVSLTSAAIVSIAVLAEDLMPAIARPQNSNGAAIFP